MNSITKKTTLYEANIDSLNISHPNVLKLFMHKDEYEVVRVHPVAKEEKDEKEHYYKKYFGKSFYNQTERGRVSPFSEVYVVHSEIGATFPITLHNRSKNSAYTIVLAGIYGYKERSEQLLTLLSDIWDDIQDFNISRVDVAIDVEEELPKKVETSLLESGRNAFIYKNTTYYNKLAQKKGRKKRDSYVNVYTYNKTKKDKTKELSAYDKVTRLELQFRSAFMRDTKVKDFEVKSEKIKKYILNNAGIAIEFSKLIPQKPESCTTDSIQSNIMYLETYLLKLKMAINSFQFMDKKTKQLPIDIITRETIINEVSSVVIKTLRQYFDSNKEKSALNENQISNDMRHDILEIKRNQEHIITLLTPVFTISTVAKMSGRTPQAVRDWLNKNAEPEVDFQKKRC